MDEIDAKIIGALYKNARKSYREIARELDVSLATVANRVRKLESDGVIVGYIPLVDQQEVGFDLQAIISIRISHGKLMEVQQRISKDKHVWGVYDVTGGYDAIVLARFRSRSEMNTFLKKLVAMKDVERTETNIVLNVVKDEKRVML